MKIEQNAMLQTQGCLNFGMTGGMKFRYKVKSKLHNGTISKYDLYSNQSVCWETKVTIFSPINIAINSTAVIKSAKITVLRYTIRRNKKTA